VTPSGIKSATFRLVAQCLNQPLPPRVPAKKLSASQKEYFSMEFDADCIKPIFLQISVRSYACKLEAAGEIDDLQVLRLVQNKHNDTN
jgi:hypothetical protein